MIYLTLKNLRDQHFSKISYYLKQSEYQKRFENVQEICDALSKNQIEANNRKSKKDQLKNDYLVIANPKLEIPSDQHKFKIKQIESLYNIQSVKRKNKYEIYTTVFSDLDELIPIDVIHSSEKIRRAEKEKEVDKEPFQLEPALNEIDSKLSYLTVKRRNIRRNLNQAENYSKRRKNRIHDANDENSDEDLDTTINEITPDESTVPIACRLAKEHKTPCNKHCYFNTLEQIRETNIDYLSQELEIHNHPKTIENKALKIKSNSKFANTQVLRDILIEHYKAYHNYNEEEDDESDLED